MHNDRFYDREASWLAFNHRVLQEIKDPSVPLYERIKFLAIYANNLDEFFRVRVATVRSLFNLKEKDSGKLLFEPKLQLKNIMKTVASHQKEIKKVYGQELIPELKKNNIYLIDNSQLNGKQKQFLNGYFENNILQHIQPLLLIKKKITPFLKNGRLYLVIKMRNKSKSGKPAKRAVFKYALVEIPSNHLPRFIELPSEKDKHYLIFLDDIIRYKIPKIFSAYDVIECYSIKLTRDAELYIEDEFSGNLLSKIISSLKKRNIGLPARFEYDEGMPRTFFNYVKESFQLKKADLSPAGKYHNKSDFFSFPNPVGKELEYPPHRPLKEKRLKSGVEMFDAIKEKDHYLFFPYHSFEHVVDFLHVAAEDPKVVSIKMTQYRVAKNSKVVKAMIKAAKNGKNVTVFVELKARFDEEQNFLWAQEMERNGVAVYYSFPGVKVHSKLALITRQEENAFVDYAFLGTGNFNESTAKIYSDLGLFTTDIRLTSEVEYLFEFLVGRNIKHKFQHLLIAKFNIRKVLNRLIDREIENARAGKKGYILLKMNSLEDKKMINKLYEASAEGVKIDLIIRGICCLLPGVLGLSENISAISIIDKFLEHSRIYVFHNDGNPQIYSGSADWMRRNLDRRIETLFPIYDERIKSELLDILNVQLNDNVKAREIDINQKNAYVKRLAKDEPVRSQIAIYEYLKGKE